jgi:hypothetical protein
VLAVPIAITFQVRLSVTRKVIMLTSLCSTVIITILSVIRVAVLGIGDIDKLRSRDLWGLLWLMIIANISVILGATLSLRPYYNWCNGNKLPQHRSSSALIPCFGAPRENQTIELRSLPTAHISGHRTQIEAGGIVVYGSLNERLARAGMP